MIQPDKPTRSGSAILPSTRLRTCGRWWHGFDDPPAGRTDHGRLVPLSTRNTVRHRVRAAVRTGQTIPLDALHEPIARCVVRLDLTLDFPLLLLPLPLGCDVRL